jgi:hypothetical protein
MVAARGFVKMKQLLILFLMIFLSGCYGGTVKPFVNRPEFKTENEPVRTLRILMITDGSYREEEIERLVSKCSRILEIQVGMKLEIVDSQQIKWGSERKDASKLLMKIVTETWDKGDHFDIAVAFAYVSEAFVGGFIDGIFWRYVVVKILDPNVLLHEVFHAFLLKTEHGKGWLMQPVLSPYGSEWYWLIPEERKEVLRNKWRDFNVVPAVGEDKRGTTRESGFHYYVGVDHLARKEYRQAVSSFDKSIEVDPEYASPRATLAWLLATAGKKEMRDGKRAVELALKACELTEWNTPGYLDVLAAACARAGDFEQAIKWQEKALEGMKSFDENIKRRVRDRLRFYRDRKPWPPD